MIPIGIKRSGDSSNESFARQTPLAITQGLPKIINAKANKKNTKENEAHDETMRIKSNIL